MNTDSFIARHNGPRVSETSKMFKVIGVSSMDELIDKTVPKAIRLEKPLNLPEGISEYEYLNKIKDIASKNKLYKSFIGQGYYGTITPSVIIRNILENPAWYTSYTPYQAEISQGRLEALLNYQTVITDLTGMEIANASLLDEATAAAEAMNMMFNSRSRNAVKVGANKMFVDNNIFPQTLAVLKTRALPLDIEIVLGDFKEVQLNEMFFGAIVQYPDANGKVIDYTEFVNKVHAAGGLVTAIADILSLVMLTPPSEWGADIAVGSTQRLGLPLGFGGPHAGYFATKDALKRSMPGRIIGISVDASGKTCLRMALQTREQHIKRERATSNICTAQALLANMSGMYAVYHGKEGLQRIANQIHSIAGFVAETLKGLGYKIENNDFFDTIMVNLPDNVKSENIQKIALSKCINFLYKGNTVGISIDETCLLEDVNNIIEIFATANNKPFNKVNDVPEKVYFNSNFTRKKDFLNIDLFKKYRSETEMMRYIKKLERKDFSLTHSMISLGSCTMKLNAATEMLPLSWAEFGNVHPFVPADQAKGYMQLIDELGSMLKVITGFDAISFQPNSGAAGEYAGLMVIRNYFKKKGEKRNVILIPSSAHGTNPASAVMAGFKVVVIACEANGNISVDDLRKRADEHKDDLAGFMITYPSTHGVFESTVIEMTDIIHNHGGLVYMDGANMNAQVGLTNPARIGADVCHLNLHKTFAIPHGGGGPGVGPIACTKQLAEFLPSHPVIKIEGAHGSAVAAAPYGSANVLVISHAYCMMAGGKGLTEATKYAILNANYIASSLKSYFDILYTGENHTVAHEMILDCRKFKDIAHISEADIAKRLMDYGFHAPTLSFPVHGTLMVEPTESESLQELDRFIESMISIYNEIMEVKSGKADENDNVLKNAPHTAQVITADKWEHKYNRSKAAYPLKWIEENKFFPTVSRIDDAYGDRNLVCSCAPLYEYTEAKETNTVVV